MAYAATSSDQVISHCLILANGPEHIVSVKGK